MPQLAIAQQNITASEWLSPLSNADINQICEVNQLSPNSRLPVGNFLSLEPTDEAFGIVNFMNTLPAREKEAIRKVAQCCGDETHSLAGFMSKYYNDRHLSDIGSFIGAGAAAADLRITSFGKAVAELQVALDRLWSLSRNGRVGRGPAASRMEARTQVRVKYAELQRIHEIELRAFAPEAAATKNRGDAFSNSERGILLAERKPNSPKKDIRLNVENRFKASNLATMGKVVNSVGNVAVGLDVGLRVMRVQEIKETGGDWMQESVRQMTGFGTGGAAGAFLGRVAFSGGIMVAAKAGLMAAGPVGWVVLGTVMVGSLLVGYYSGKFVDDLGVQFSDYLMTR